MKSTELVTVGISIIALVVSIMAVTLQYVHKDNTQFKITKTELVSHQPQKERDRSFAIVLNISVFNMGNRPVALDSLTLSLDGEINADSDYVDVEESSNRVGEGLLIPPMTSVTYNKLEFHPVVIKAGDIYSKEVVFNLFHYEIGRKYITARGELKLTGIFYNAKGSNIEVTVPVAQVDIMAVRNEDSSAKIDFDASEGLLHKVKF